MKYDYEKRAVHTYKGDDGWNKNRYYILPLPLVVQIRGITSIFQYFNDVLDTHDFKIRYGRWNLDPIFGKGYQIESVGWDLPIYIIEEGSNFVLRNENGEVIASCWDARVSFYLAAIFAMADRDPGKFRKLLISDLKGYQC